MTEEMQQPELVTPLTPSPPPTPILQTQPEALPEPEPQEQQPEEKPRNNLWQKIVQDFDKRKGGDRKLLRAVGRTALVNAAVAASALTGGAATPFIGYATGGAITAKRLNDGLQDENPQEVAKSLAVFGSATTASLVGQLVAGGLMIGVAGAAIPVAAVVAFGVGCTSGITAGALSEWGVDHICEHSDDFKQFWVNKILQIRNGQQLSLEHAPLAKQDVAELQLFDYAMHQVPSSMEQLQPREALSVQ